MGGTSAGGAGGTVVNLIVLGNAVQSAPPGSRLAMIGTALLSGVMVTAVPAAMMTSARASAGLFPPTAQPPLHSHTPPE